MICINRATLWIILASVFVMSPLESRAQLSGETIIVEEPVEGDLYIAGGEVEVLAPVSGDAVIAGGTVRLSGRIDGDVISAGGNLRLLGQVTDDVRLAGGKITLQGTVSGHAVAAGGDVRISEKARIKDFAWLAGGRLTIAGTVGGDLKAAGQEIIISGRIDGNTELTGEIIQIDDNAIINGNLTWSSSNEPQISKSAKIIGEISEEEFRVRGWEPEPARTWLGGFFVVITLTLTAGFLFSIFPDWSNQLAKSARERPVASPLAGLAVMATTPLVMVLLFMTGVGALLGLLITLGYGLMLLLGGLFGLIAAASQLGSLIGKQGPVTHKIAWLGILITALIIVLFSSIQPLGLILVSLILLYGLGALALDTYKIFQKTRK